MSPKKPNNLCKSVLFILFLFLYACGGAPKGNYLPANHQSNPQWLKASQIIVRLGKISDPSKSAGEWKLGFIKNEKINAYSAGGGAFYVTDGFTRLPDKYQEAILAHELGHDLSGHRNIKIGVNLGLNVVFSVLNVFIPGAGYLRHAVNPVVVKGFSKPQELEADRLAALILIKDKGDLSGVKNLRDFFSAAQSTSGDKGGGLFDTHPAYSERVQQFEDILNGKVIPEASFISKKLVASAIQNYRGGKSTPASPKVAQIPTEEPSSPESLSLKGESRDLKKNASSAPTETKSSSAVKEPSPPRKLESAIISKNISPNLKLSSPWRILKENKSNTHITNLSSETPVSVLLIGKPFENSPPKSVLGITRKTITAILIDSFRTKLKQLDSKLGGKTKNFVTPHYLITVNFNEWKLYTEHMIYPGAIVRFSVVGKYRKINKDGEGIFVSDISFKNYSAQLESDWQESVPDLVKETGEMIATELFEEYRGY